MRVRSKKEIPKLNLIPILDAIFIFIFFLLMSAQFIDIYELNSDAPITSMAKNNQKEPLNLTITLKKDIIRVTTGLNNKLIATFHDNELENFNTQLINIKQLHPKESSAIIRPTNNYPYHKIIKVIDYTREVQKKNTLVTSINDKEKKQQTKKLFDQIIFETME
jgi:biopolymer transport protein ExbD